MTTETEPDVAAVDLLTHVVQSTAPGLAEETTRLEVAGDVAGLAALLAAFRRARTTLAFLESETETALANIMPTNIVTIADIGVLERRSGRRRSAWDHPRLSSLLAARAADERYDRTTGEALPPAVFAQHITDELMATAGISYWKVSELKRRGIDASAYCEEVAGRDTVTIREASL